MKSHQGNFVAQLDFLGFHGSILPFIYCSGPLVGSVDRTVLRKIGHAVMEKRTKKSISLAWTADSADGLPDEEGRKPNRKSSGARR
jgi:hypothetical protein